jgi:hypothetical protein
MQQRVNVNRSIFAPTFVNKHRADMAIDLASAVDHAHTNRDAFAVARIKNANRTSRESGRVCAG